MNNQSCSAATVYHADIRADVHDAVRAAVHHTVYDVRAAVHDAQEGDSDE